MKLTLTLLFVVLFSIVVINAAPKRSSNNDNDSDNSDGDSSNIFDSLDQSDKTSHKDELATHEPQANTNGNDDLTSIIDYAAELLAHAVAEVVAEFEAANAKAAVNAPEPSKMGKPEGNQEDNTQIAEGVAAKDTSDNAADDEAEPMHDVDSIENQSAESTIDDGANDWSIADDMNSKSTWDNWLLKAHNLLNLYHNT